MLFCVGSSGSLLFCCSVSRFLLLALCFHCCSPRQAAKLSDRADAKSKSSNSSSNNKYEEDLYGGVVPGKWATKMIPMQYLISGERRWSEGGEDARRQALAHLPKHVGGERPGSQLPWQKKTKSR